MSVAAARAARTTLERLMAGEPAATKLELEPGTMDRLERYVALLLDANRRLNLTRIVAPEDVAGLHLLDALAALPVVDELAPERGVDLGAGGGVPGLVLAMARPSVTWTLVDAERRKADALRGFADALNLANVVVIAERAENLGRQPAHRERHDLVTARACAPLPVLVEYAVPLLTQGGSLVAWKGPMSDTEREAGDRAAAELGGAPPTARDTGMAALGEHRFVLVRRAAPVPDRFPRRPGVPARRPLG